MHHCPETKIVIFVDFIESIVKPQFIFAAVPSSNFKLWKSFVQLLNILPVNITLSANQRVTYYSLILKSNESGIYLKTLYNKGFVKRLTTSKNSSISNML